MVPNGPSLVKDSGSIAVLILSSKDGMENSKKMLPTKLLKATQSHKVSKNLNKSSIGPREFERKRRDNKKDRSKFRKKNHKRLSPLNLAGGTSVPPAEVEVEGTARGLIEDQKRKAKKYKNLSLMKHKWRRFSRMKLTHLPTLNMINTFFSTIGNNQKITS